ncbi:MAG: polysaccharide deacetylase [Candidatus Nephthysia bennettiae]|uniref:Polysaccharide deacetylase n=1 Tax=Candidatus Nephthysia bennettiae TaxID=3127016 RepID=A0A934K201_9BACT|nr:polysaccharide deacetylase [Candidatus Dormibacteraeota bacterium]MBJ7613645.1 polysaccharide deacetylase [Candidatus Dormibacteraeota bacterium]PZS00152.1 MAG: polysaccharide deacetylase [Candidatus Dormibacteraeota bacterium]
MAIRGAADNHRISVALTFDFDAESVWLGSFKVDTPSALSRGAYGANEGVPRILKLLDRYQLPATFFIPGDTADRHPKETRNIAAAGHEIGHHGYCHEPPHTLTEREEKTMLERGLDALDRIVKCKPRGYRSPSWELSTNTYRLLAEYGFDYDASQLAWDRPYWVEDAGKNTNIVEVPGAWELTDSAHFLYALVPVYLAGLSATSKVEEIWLGDFDGAYAEGGDVCYVLTMHPQIIGRHHRIAMLERALKYILGHPGVWFAQMSEIADDFRRRQSEEKKSS